MYVCMYVCMYVRVCVYNIYVCVSVCVYIYVYIHIYINSYIDVCIPSLSYLYIHIYINSYIDVCIPSLSYLWAAKQAARDAMAAARGLDGATAIYIYRYMYRYRYRYIDIFMCLSPPSSIYRVQSRRHAMQWLRHAASTAPQLRLCWRANAALRRGRRT